MTNCTLNGNAASVNGGALYNAISSPMTLANCIVWGNGTSALYGSPTATYSCIEGALWPGIGNINADPRFAAAGDAHLLSTSPCIDAGNNGAVPAGVSTDLDGRPRFVDVPGIPDSGNGTPPIVDMGAYECAGTVRPDFDQDGDVDLVDFSFFQACFNGPNRDPARTGCD